MSDERTPEQIEAEIAAQREQLANTVDHLAAKLDVKSQAKQKVASLKGSAATATSQARQKAVSLQGSATTDAGKPRPEVLGAAGSLIAMAVVLIVWRYRKNH